MIVISPTINPLMQAIEKKLKQSSVGGLTYIGELRANRVEKKMDHLSCFSGGMFGLGAQFSNQKDHYIELGEKIAETCHKAYDNTGSCLKYIDLTLSVMSFLFSTFLLFAEY